MGLKEDFQRALRETEIHRHREATLLTVGSTELPYVWLGESAINMGDTVIRRGFVRVEKPQILLVHAPIQFEGFEYGDNPNESGAFLALGRIASFPPGKYSNIEMQLDIFEGPLRKAIGHFSELLDQKEDASTGLVTGPADIWALSLFVYVGNMVAKSVPDDLHNLLRRLHPPGRG